MSRLNTILLLFTLGFLFLTTAIDYFGTSNLNKSIGWVTYWDYFNFRDLIIVLITGTAMYFSDHKAIQIGGKMILILMVIYRVAINFYI